MINIATLCDKNYLAKGLAMRQSLIDLGVEHRIYWLCVDDETEDILTNRVKDNRIITYRLSDFEKEDEQLNRSKNNAKSKYGSQRDNYIWSLTPYFVNYVLRNCLDEDEYLMYVDSDLQFFSSPQKILGVIGNKSIGLHTHRFTPTRKKINTGIYNVGVVVFRNNFIGNLVSDKWKYWVMNPGNPYYEEYGTCGDQKYLEAFFLICDHNDISIFDQDGLIFHGAPWCCNDLKDKKIDFYHFSHFKIVSDSEWRDSYHGEWNPTRYTNIKILYEEYFAQLKSVSDEFKLRHLFNN